MSRYKRYGYIVVQDYSHQGGPEHTEIIGFHPNPDKANAFIDNLLSATKTAKEITEISMPKASGMPGEVIRQVFIKYPRGSTSTLSVERWWFEVGRNNE